MSRLRVGAYYRHGTIPKGGNLKRGNGISSQPAIEDQVRDYEAESPGCLPEGRRHERHREPGRPPLAPRLTMTPFQLILTTRRQ